MSGITFQETRNFPLDQLVDLYTSNSWSAAHKPEQLQEALRDSHSLVSAWDDDRLIGLGNAISDGHLVVYYSHLLVHPDYQGRGIGSELMRRLSAPYQDFHQQIVVADGRATDFYKKHGFRKVGSTQSMWIFKGDEH